MRRSAISIGRPGRSDGGNYLSILLTVERFTKKVYNFAKTHGISITKLKKNLLSREKADILYIMECVDSYEQTSEIAVTGKAERKTGNGKDSQYRGSGLRENQDK